MDDERLGRLAKLLLPTHGSGPGAATAPTAPTAANGPVPLLLQLPPVPPPGAEGPAPEVRLPSSLTSLGLLLQVRARLHCVVRRGAVGL